MAWEGGDKRNRDTQHTHDTERERGNRTSHHTSLFLVETRVFTTQTHRTLSTEEGRVSVERLRVAAVAPLLLQPLERTLSTTRARTHTHTAVAVGAGLLAP